MKHLRLFKDREEFNAADLEYPTLSLIQEDNSMVIDETPPTIIAKYVFEEDVPEGTFCFYSDQILLSTCGSYGISVVRSFTSFEVNGEELVTPPSPAVSLGTYYPTALSLDPLNFSEDSFLPAETTYAEIKFSKPVTYLGIYLETNQILEVMPIPAIQQEFSPFITVYSDDFIRFNCASFLEYAGLGQDRVVLFSANSETPESIEEVNSYSPIAQAFSGDELILNPGNNKSWPAGEYTVKMEFDRKHWAQFNYFFKDCTGLREIYCNGNFIRGIFSKGFCHGARNLETIVISSNNFIDRLEESFCFNCYGLTTVIFPESVTSMGEWAFAHCTSLTTITIPESVTSIESCAFEDCDSLTSITIPESVTSIESYAFYYCSSLTSIIVEEGNTTYDSRDNCNAIIETSSNCLIAGSAATIIPGSVTSIGSVAFLGCSSLTSITIPEGVTSIGTDAFLGCTSITSITCNAVTPPIIGYSTFGSFNESIPVYVPASSINAYKAARYWSSFTNFQAIS